MLMSVEMEKEFIRVMGYKKWFFSKLVDLSEGIFYDKAEVFNVMEAISFAFNNLDLVVYAFQPARV